MAVPDSILEYVRKALDKKFPAVVIRTALKKAGHDDQTISEAFEQVRKEREAAAQPKTKEPKPLPKVPSPKPESQKLFPDEDIPPPPPQHDDWVEIPHPQPDDVQQKRKIHVRHIIVAALFLIAVILLMYATLAPMLLRVT